MKEVLVVLGSPNDTNGELSAIAKSRLNFAAEQYAPGKFILCTGGWGKHFNLAKESHAYFAKRYLVDNGIPDHAFLEFALSGNTVEDAVKSKEILSPMNNINVTIITSHFHLERVKLIFDQIFSGMSFKYEGVSDDFLPADQRAILEAHEKAAIASIRQNGLYY